VFKRTILIILDACGVGELPDAGAYGDTGAATIPHVAEALGGLNMPHAQALGLGNIVPIKGINPVQNPRAAFGKMQEQSPGKDSTSGHWEIAGLVLKKPFPVYPHGFPDSLISEFEQRASVKIIGNIPASGTEIIEKLGPRHIKMGEIILYTSADSVFQLAAHEEIISVEKLYEICRIARKLLSGEHAVGRVIARPFTGRPGSFTRTVNRHDFSLEPPGDTVLNLLMRKNIPTIGIGKIPDLFADCGISCKVKAINNNEVMFKVIDEMKSLEYGLIFANLVDFDMLWGHRNDTASFGAGLEQFDRQLPELLDNLKNDDLLIITADHGCDPTLKYSTDHTREYVPLLAFHKNFRRGRNLGIRSTFADIAATLAENFAIEYTCPGTSFLKDLRD